MLPVKRQDVKKEIPKGAFENMLWQCMLASGVLIYGSHSILINLSKENGKIPYNSASVVLLIELAKLLFSVVMFIPEVLEGKLKAPPISSMLAFSVPAFLYCINNNVVVYIQLYLDPASFQVLSNLKIVTTAFLYRAIIKRPISVQQWTAISILTLAGFSNGYGGMHSKSNDTTVDQTSSVTSQIYVTFTGVVLMLVYCTISGLAGVYTEYILKRHYTVSLHQQNILMYVFGVMFNLWAYSGTVSFYASSTGFQGFHQFFEGYSLWTVIIIVTQASNGLIMSAVMKHASNITRLLVISCAMVVTTFLSVVIFSMKLNIFFLVAVVLVFVALAIYHRKT